MSTKSKYPKSIWFIFGDEFCERYSFYGLKAILVLFLISFQKYDYVTATVIFHIFLVLAFVTPFFGAILSDSYWGKYKTIYVLSIIHAVGNVVVAVASLINFVDLKFQRSLTIIGLGLLAIGAGGIKPCVSSFGGDQFVLPDQEEQLRQFFSIFYFAVNAGSLVSTFVSPELRTVQCFGQETCFPLAFGLPALLMAISLVFFVSGKRYYTMKKPVSSIVATSLRCMFQAIKNKTFASAKEPKKKNWLEYAGDEFGAHVILDLRFTLDVMVMFIPIPIFYTLFDQQGSSWVLQATLMDGKIDFLNWTLKPDQVHLINPLFILIFLPLFEAVVYPLLYKIGVNSPLRKVVLGGMIAALSFVCAAVVQYTIMGENLNLSLSEGRLRIYNDVDCRVTVSGTSGDSFSVEPLNVFQNDYGQRHNATDVLSVDVDPSCRLKTKILKQPVSIPKGEISSYLLTDKDDGLKLTRLNGLSKLKSGQANTRILHNDYLIDRNIILRDVNNKNKFHDNGISIRLSSNMSHIHEIPVGTYDLYLDREYVSGEVFFYPFSVNDLLLHQSRNYTNAKLITFEKGKYIPIVWQFPQVIIITVAEAIFVVTLLEFAFTQAPLSMKSFVASIHHFSHAIGNLIIIILSKLKLFNNRGDEFIFYATLMVLSMALLMLLSIRYKYKCMTEKPPKIEHPTSNTTCVS